MTGVVMPGCNVWCDARIVCLVGADNKICRRLTDKPTHHNFGTFNTVVIRKTSMTGNARLLAKGLWRWWRPLAFAVHAI